MSTEEETNGNHRGDDPYDPHENDNEETMEIPSKTTRNEQLKSESIQSTNNGTYPSPVNHNNNHRPKHSDRRSRSPSHHSHHHPSSSSSSSDRKRLRPSSPSLASTDSSRSRYRSRHRSSSRSPSPSHDKSSSVDQIKNDSHYNRHRSHSSRHHHHHHHHSSSKWSRPSPPPSTSSSVSSSSQPTATTTNDRNRLKNVNETNGSSQRSRSNLIQIVTNEPPVRLASTIVKAETTQIPVESISNGNSTGQMLMEEMLLDEEREQTSAKTIDLDSLTIPETIKEKVEKKQPIEPIKSNPPTPIAVPSLTPSPSPTKTPYMLYKVPNTNHTTPSLSARYKKAVKPENDTNDENSRRTSLEERLSTMFGSNRTPSNEQILETRSNPPQTLSTPSDQSNGSPQDIPVLISTTTTTTTTTTNTKKANQTSELTIKKHSLTEERRPSGSKTYTSQWIATQKPEEATVPTEELPTFPPLVNLPTLVSTQNNNNNNPSTIDDSKMLGKLSEAMKKLIQKQGDTTQGTTTNTTTTAPPPPSTEGDDAVPISAKHLERLERRKEREKLQSEIAAIAKEALKPAFKKRDITKDEYKEIMKKVVTRVTDANEVDRVRIGKMIDGYLEKFRLIHQHKKSTEKTTTKTSNANGNSHPSVPLTHSR